MGQWCRVNHHFLPFHFAVLSLYARAIILGNKSMTLLVFFVLFPKSSFSISLIYSPIFSVGVTSRLMPRENTVIRRCNRHLLLDEKVTRWKVLRKGSKKLLFVRLNILYLIIFSCWTWMQIKIRSGSEEVELPEMRALLSSRVSPPTGKQKHIF